MPKEYSVTLIPGDGIGPEVMAAAVRVLSATGIVFHWETVMAGAEAAGTRGQPAAPRRPRIHPAQQGGAEGPHRHAHRHRTSLGERRAPEDARPLREPAPGGDPARGEEPLRQRRPHRGAREHRGPLQRARARGGAGRGGVDQDHHREGLDAHREVRLRLRARARPQADHRHPQGQHHEAVGRPLPGLLPGGGGRRIRRSPTTR